MISTPGQRLTVLFDLRSAADSRAECLTVFEVGPDPDEEPQPGTELPQDGLYFVSVPTGFCKIGRTANIDLRLATLQNANPHPLKLELWLPGRGWQEPVWHTAFRHIRERGEWFQCTTDLARAINAAEEGREWIATLRHPSNPDMEATYRWRDRIADAEEHALVRAERAPACREVAHV